MSKTSANQQCVRGPFRVNHLIGPNFRHVHMYLAYHNAYSGSIPLGSTSRRWLAESAAEEYTQKIPHPLFPAPLFYFFSQFIFPAPSKAPQNFPQSHLNMSGIRKILESPPANPDKRAMSPKNKRKEREEQQWYTAGWRTPPSNPQPNVARPAKKKRVVPEQLNFTEGDSLASLRAQVAGLRAENAKLRAQNEELQDDNGMAINNYSVLERHYKAQEERHAASTARQKVTENILLNNCRQYEREKVANEARWAAKEADVRRLQREFNDAVNSLLAVDV